MICPNCGSHIDEGLLVCPACHAELDKTTVMPRISAKWCSSCGTLLPEGAKECPSCHMPTERSDEHKLPKSLTDIFAKSNKAAQEIEYSEPSFRPESMAASFATLEERGLDHLPDPDDGKGVDDKIDPDSTAVAKALNFAKEAVKKQAEEMAVAALGSASKAAIEAAKKEALANAQRFEEQERGSAEAHSEASEADKEVSSTSTNMLPRIDSAIPEDPTDDEPFGQDHLPRMRVLLTALILAAIFISSGILYMTQPWNPEAFSSRATKDADTSMAGFPGTIDSLAGQDNKSGSVEDADEVSYNQLHEIWKKLGDLEKKADDSEAELKSNWNGVKATRKKAFDTVDALRYEISNEISAIADVDTSTGTYTESAKSLTTLGNYLRNRIDALYSAWQKAEAADDVETEEENIFSSVGGKQMTVTQSWRSQFEDMYSDSEPKAAKS